MSTFFQGTNQGMQNSKDSLIRLCFPYQHSLHQKLTQKNYLNSLVFCPIQQKKTFYPQTKLSLMIPLTIKAGTSWILLLGWRFLNVKTQINSKRYLRVFDIKIIFLQFMLYMGNYLSLENSPSLINVKTTVLRLVSLENSNGISFNQV